MKGEALDLYSKHSLYRMGFYKVNDRWTRVRGVRLRDDEDEEPTEEEGPSSPHANVVANEELFPPTKDVGGPSDILEGSERQSGRQHR